MEILYFEDIYSKLEYFDCGTESNIYKDKDGLLCYKIFKKNHYSLKRLNRKSKKIQILACSSGDSMSRVVLPTSKIMNKEGEFLGYIMKYIPNTQTLSSFKGVDNLLISKILYEISQSVRKIHQDSRKIIISDLHFGNILVDKDLQHYFVDFDSCSISGIPNEAAPYNLADYQEMTDISTFRLIKEVVRGINGYAFYTETDQNTDKLCLILATLEYIFDKSFLSITNDEYDSKCEQIPFLNNMKSYFLYLKKFPKIREVPYLDEFIPVPNKIIRK